MTREEILNKIKEELDLWCEIHPYEITGFALVLNSDVSWGVLRSNLKSSELSYFAETEKFKEMLSAIKKSTSLDETIEGVLNERKTN